MNKYSQDIHKNVSQTGYMGNCQMTSYSFSRQTGTCHLQNVLPSFSSPLNSIIIVFSSYYFPMNNFEIFIPV